MEGLRKDFKAMFEKALFADTRLICFNEKGEEMGKRVEIPVHRAILMARSKFFAGYFADGRDELEIPEDFPAKLIKIGIAYLYTDTIPADLNEEELILLYKASEHYDLDIFETEAIQLELSMVPFPRTSAELKNASEFSSGACSKNKQWRAEMRVFSSSEFTTTSLVPSPRTTLNDEPLVKRAKTVQKNVDVVVRGSDDHSHSSATTRSEKRQKQVHLDFALEECHGGDNQNPALITGLSLSILNFAGEKVKTVKRENLSLIPKHPGLGKNKLCWEDCFDYDEIVDSKNRLLQYRDCLNQPQLVVLAEVAVVGIQRPQETLHGVCVSASAEDWTELQSDFADLLEKGRFPDARIVVVCCDHEEDFSEEVKEEKEEGGNNRKKVLEFPVHKGILAARSKFFAAAFSSGMKEAESGEVEVPAKTGFSPPTIRAMLQFVYTGSIPTTLLDDFDGLVSLFKAAHFYDLHELLDRCTGLLRPTVENCAEMLSLAHTYAHRGLMTKALKFLRENKGAVKASDGWCRLMVDSSDGQEALKKLCGHWLLELPLSFENCCEVLRLAHCHGDGELERVALTFLLFDEDAVRETEGWRRVMEKPGSEEEGEALKRLIEGEKQKRRKTNSIDDRSSGSPVHYSTGSPAYSDYQCSSEHSEDDYYQDYYQSPLTYGLRKRTGK